MTTTPFAPAHTFQVRFGIRTSKPSTFNLQLATKLAHIGGHRPFAK
jgi:hypothetical protein